MLGSRVLITALVVATLISCSGAVDFWGTARLYSISVPDKYFNCTVYNVDTILTDVAWRIEINVDPLDFTNREVIVRRLNSTEGVKDSQMQFQLPFDASVGPGFDCCINEAFGATAYFKMPAVINGTFTIPRKDGFQNLVIQSVYTNRTRTELLDIILGRNSSTASWTDVGAVCPVMCLVQANYVFVVDISASITDSNYRIMGGFMQDFSKSVSVSGSAANIGVVLFAGAKSSAYVSNTDLYCMRDWTGYLNTQTVPLTVTAPGVKNSTTAFNLWQQALGDPNWYENVGWVSYEYNGTTSSSYLSGVSNIYCFTQPPITTVRSPFCFSGCGGQCCVNVYGWTLAYLYITPDSQLVETSFDWLANGARFGTAEYTGTAMGTGIHQGIDLFERAAVYRPTVPEIMIFLTDGEPSAGEGEQDVASFARKLGITIYGLAIGPGANVQTVYNITGQAWNRTFVVPAYQDFSSILEPLLQATCLGDAGTGASCPNCPSDSLCTTCSQCVTCVSDSGCDSCSSCNLVTRQCTTNPISVNCPFAANTSCDQWVCNPIGGCQQFRNFDLEFEYESECVLNRSGTWNTTLCFCDIPITDNGDGDGGNQDGVIIGSTVGAVGGAVAATAATAAGALLLLGLLLAALALLALAALIIGAVLLIGLIVLAVVGGIGIAGLVAGIQMMVPPAIQGVDIANPAEITAMENPMAKTTEWTASSVQAE